MMPPTKDHSFVMMSDSVAHEFSYKEFVRFKVEHRLLTGQIIHDKKVGYGMCVVKTAIGRKYLLRIRDLIKIPQPKSRLKKRKTL